jgi:hypothetical protein
MLLVLLRGWLCKELAMEELLMLRDGPELRLRGEVEDTLISDPCFTDIVTSVASLSLEGTADLCVLECLRLRFIGKESDIASDEATILF